MAVIKATVEVVGDDPGDPRVLLECYEAGPAAQEAVRFKFNPSALHTVDRIKLLSSLLVAEINTLRTLAAPNPPDQSSPEWSTAWETFGHARQLAIDASMNAVLGATKGL